MKNFDISDFSRRGVLLGGGALGLTSCGRSAGSGTAPAASAAPAASTPMTLAKAVAGDWRLSEDKARDVWRHPVDSLSFWGVKPGAVVVEFWPGAGWYTDILAPYLAANGGVLYAAGMPTDQPAAQQVLEAYRRKLAAKPKLYGDVRLTIFGPTSGPVAPAGSADVVLFLRNLHNWMAGGFAEKAFHDAFQALKPGGVLGVEEHRAPPGGAPDLLAANGYVPTAYVQQMAKEAGFVFDKASEINANPNDDHDHPFGVWTLPPTRRSAPEGKPANPAFDHRKYDAIGESDRMTLRFVKPK